MGCAQGGALRGGASRRSLHPSGSSAPERRWAVRSSRTLCPAGHLATLDDAAGSAVLSDTARRSTAGVKGADAALIPEGSRGPSFDGGGRHPSMGGMSNQ